MNDGGDCRTAPATPGLLKTSSNGKDRHTDTQTDIATYRLTDSENC